MKLKMMLTGAVALLAIGCAGVGPERYRSETALQSSAPLRSAQTDLALAHGGEASSKQPEELVCETRARTGTNIPDTRCRTEVELRDERERTQRLLMLQREIRIRR